MPNFDGRGHIYMILSNWGCQSSKLIVLGALWMWWNFRWKSANSFIFIVEMVKKKNYMSIKEVIDNMTSNIIEWQRRIHMANPNWLVENPW